MAKRHRPNYRLVKIHYSYSVEDIATLFNVHKNTVREWLRRGLPTIDTKRPLLILGSALARFLRDRRLAGKRPCKLGEIYCVKCREPRAPLGGLVEFKVIREPLGNLSGICPVCDSLMYRRANRQKLPAILAALKPRPPEAELHISQNGAPSVNNDFTLSGRDHANAQRAE